MRRFFIAVILGILLMFPIQPVFAQTDASAQENRNVRATVTRIVETREEDGNTQTVFESQDAEGKTYRVDTAESSAGGARFSVKEGDRVVLSVFTDLDGTERAYLTDFQRLPQLMWILVLFIVLTVAVGWLRGFSALLGLAATLLILLGFIFPQILAGRDAVLVTSIGCVGILAVNMHLSHGFNRRTFAAFAATVAGLGLAAIFAKLFVGWAHLSGVATEEELFLSIQAVQIHAPVGILLAGILLGATGVLDDVAVTQVETVAEIREADPSLSTKDLFLRGMRVGRHHIASTVNTLVLAYAGASAPLFLLFMNYGNLPWDIFLNTEAIAAEFVRTLAGTCALVLTVPIATWIAAALPAGKPVRAKNTGDIMLDNTSQ